MDKVNIKSAGFFRTMCVLFIGAVFALGSIAFVGCGGDDTTPPTPEPTLLKVTGTIQDVKTLVGVPTAKVTSFTGLNKDDIKDADGNKITTATADADGKVVLYISSSLNPSEMMPVTFTVNAEKLGYLDNAKAVGITAAADSTFTINMVNIDQTPSGVTVKEDDSGAATDGKVVEEIKVTTPSVDQEGETVGTANVDIGAGTEAKDKDGNPAADGTLSTTVAFYDARSDKAVDAIPGGTTNAAAIVETGVAEVGTLKTGGYITVDVKDSAGNNATSFDPAINIVLTIVKGTLNPDTGEAIVDGEVMDLYMYNAEEALWEWETKVTAVENADENFDLTFTVSHLTCFSFSKIKQTKCFSLFNYTISNYTLLSSGLTVTTTIGSDSKSRTLSASSGSFTVLASTDSGCSASFFGEDPAGAYNIVSPSGSYSLDGTEQTITFTVQTGG